MYIVMKCIQILIVIRISTFSMKYTDKSNDFLHSNLYSKRKLVETLINPDLIEPFNSTITDSNKLLHNNSTKGFLSNDHINYEILNKANNLYNILNNTAFAKYIYSKAKTTSSNPITEFIKLTNHIAQLGNEKIKQIENDDDNKTIRLAQLYNWLLKKICEQKNCITGKDINKNLIDFLKKLGYNTIIDKRIEFNKNIKNKLLSNIVDIDSYKSRYQQTVYNNNKFYWNGIEIENRKHEDWRIPYLMKYNKAKNSFMCAISNDRLPICKKNKIIEEYKELNDLYGMLHSDDFLSYLENEINNVRDDFDLPLIKAFVVSGIGKSCNILLGCPKNYNISGSDFDGVYYAYNDTFYVKFYEPAIIMEIGKQKLIRNNFKNKEDKYENGYLDVVLYPNNCETYLSCVNKNYPYVYLSNKVGINMTDEKYWNTPSLGWTIAVNTHLAKICNAPFNVIDGVCNSPLVVSITGIK